MRPIAKLKVSYLLSVILLFVSGMLAGSHSFRLGAGFLHLMSIIAEPVLILCGLLASYRVLAAAKEIRYPVIPLTRLNLLHLVGIILVFAAGLLSGSHTFRSGTGFPHFLILCLQALMLGSGILSLNTILSTVRAARF